MKSTRFVVANLNEAHARRKTVDWHREAAWKIYNDAVCQGKNAKDGIDRIEQIIRDEQRKTEKANA